MSLSIEALSRRIRVSVLQPHLKLQVLPLGGIESFPISRARLNRRVIIRLVE